MSTKRGRATSNKRVDINITASELIQRDKTVDRLHALTDKGADVEREWGESWEK